MVAYSYRPRFIVPVLVGLGLIKPGSGAITVNGFEISTFVRKNLPRPKRQTIRAHGKRRHAREGEALQHYTGMRTKQCRKIGDAKCTKVSPIELWIGAAGTDELGIMVGDDYFCGSTAVREFAQADGFDTAADMVAFWRENHPGVDHFQGVLVEWAPI